MNFSKHKLPAIYPQGQSVTERVERLLRYSRTMGKHALSKSQTVAELKKLGLKEAEITALLASASDSPGQPSQKPCEPPPQG